MILSVSHDPPPSMLSVPGFLWWFMTHTELTAVSLGDRSCCQLLVFTTFSYGESVTFYVIIFKYFRDFYISLHFYFRKWSVKSPLGQNVVCTTLTTNRCCRRRPFSKVRPISPHTLACTHTCTSDLPLCNYLNPQNSTENHNLIRY